MTDKTSSALKNLNKKIDGLQIDKALSEELKEEIKVLLENTPSNSVENQLEQLNSRLDSIDSNNASLKDSIHDFVKSSSKTLEAIAKGGSEEVPDRLKEYLLEIVGKIEGLKSSISNSSVSEISEEGQLKDLKKELNFLQNEIETTLNKQLTEIGENVEKIVSDIKDQLDTFKEILDNDSEKLIMEVLSDIKQLKTDTLELSGSLKSIDEKSEKITEDTLNKIIEHSQSANEKVLNQLTEIKKVTAKSEEVENTNKESVEVLKHELTVLKNNIHGQIRDVLSKILVQDEIKFLCEEAISGIKSGNTEINVVRKHLKDMKSGDEKQSVILAETRNIISELGNYASESSDKIDMIYDNLSMVNTWASSSDAISHGFEDLCQDFELTSDKVDIIYENLTFINEWVKTLDKFSKDIEELKNSCRGEIDLPQKVNEIYENINAVREWSKKADALALQVKALSVQISETESSINAQNLNEIKKLFVQMNDNISNMNTRNNKMIIESDKSNEMMREQLKDLESLISSFAEKSESLGIEDLKQKIVELKECSIQNTEFENIVSQSFTYLAEWIDAAGSTLNSIKSDVLNLQEASKNQFEAIEEVKNAPVPENPAVPVILQELQNISAYINKKIEEESQKTPEIDFDGMRTLIEYIATQTGEQSIKSDDIEKYNQLSAKIENLETKLSSCDEKISSFETQLSSLESKVSSFGTQISSIESQAASLGVQMSSFESQMNSFKTAITSFEIQISSFEKYMSKLVDYLEED